MIEPKNFRRPKGAAKHRWIGVVVALVLGAFAAISLLMLEPHEPLPASAPANEFSAERAFSHVEQIAERPHPVGSTANAEVRDYLVEQLWRISGCAPPSRRQRLRGRWRGRPP